MKQYGIKVSKDVYALAVQKKINICRAMEEFYGDKLVEMRSEVRNADKLNNVQLALLDAGLNKHSTVSAIYTNNGNEKLFPAITELSVIEATDNGLLLNEVINTSRIVDSKDIRILKLDFIDADNKKKLEYKDVAEGATLPQAQIKESDKTLKIYKRGVQIVSSYEAVQDSPLDIFLETVKEAAIENTYTQLGDAVKTLQNGDGNNNAAGLLGATASATAITSAELIGFLFDYYDATKLPADRIVCGKSTAKIISTILYDITKVNGYAAGKMFGFPQLNFEDIKVIYDSRVDKVSNKDVGLIYNKAYGVDKYTVANSIINEFDKDITNQTQIGTLSERCGFGKKKDNAVKYFTLS